MEPLVTVVIPCYNRQRLLTKTIRSFLKQTTDNWEIIVVDDGSEDDLTFVTSIDERIRYIRKDRDNVTGGGYGAPEARNIGKRNARGKYILTFDSDDVALPDLVKRSSDYLEANPWCGAVYTDTAIKRRSGQGESNSYRDCDNTPADYEEMLRCQFIPNGGTMWRKSTMPDFDPNASSAEDWDIMLTAMEQGVKFHHIKEKLWIYRKGHEREEYTERQSQGCDVALGKRGRRFDRETRTSVKI